MGAFPCLECAKTVRRNQHAVQCDSCNGWQHRVCDTGITVTEYRAAVHGDRFLDFVCKQCALQRIDSSSVEPDRSYRPDTSIVEADRSYRQDTSIEDADRSYRPDTSIEEPVVLHERSLDNEPLPDEVIPDAPLTFEVVEKGSQKGGDLLVDSVGYSYTVKERRGNRTRWTCSVRNKTMKCTASVSQLGAAFRAGAVQHTHAPDPTRGFTSKVSRKAKDLGIGDVISSATELVSKAKETVGTGPDVGVFKSGNVARRVNRKRQALRPEDPKDMNFLLHQDSLPNDFWRDDIEEDGRRHLVFSTDKQLSVLRRATRWYVDGTFKCMRAPFVMLLTIHAFVRRADCTKQVPLVFAVMSGMRAQDYAAVFQSVKLLLAGNVPEGLVMDFEKAIWKAARQVFPGASLSGCVFHWGQAVFGRVKKLGLATQYNQNNATHNYVRQLLCLPFLPKEHIRPTFDMMVDFNTCEALVPLLTYLEDNWFRSTCWSVDEWCVYGQSVRTNNDVEGWHRRLNARTGTAPAFYNLVAILHRESQDVEEQVQLVSELALRRVQRAQYRSMQKEIFGAWDMYAKKELTATGLLKKVSKMYSPSVTQEE